MEVEILSWRDLKRRAVERVCAGDGPDQPGDWGSEPLGLVRSPEHTLRILCNDITPALVDLSDPRDMFRLFSREQAEQVARLPMTTGKAPSSASAWYGSSRSAAGGGGPAGTF